MPRFLCSAKPLEETALIQFKHINLRNVWSRFKESKPQSPEYDIRVYKVWVKVKHNYIIIIM